MFFPMFYLWDRKVKKKVFLSIPVIVRYYFCVFPIITTAEFFSHKLRLLSNSRAS